VASGCAPYREQYALALVIARSISVRLAEVAGGNGAINGTHNL
jgi:hypothetical protein